MAAIDEEEVLRAIKSLERRKASGQDGISNDVYKDFQDILVEPLTELFNRILRGESPPPSFLRAIVIPFRKKGDSSDALHYRPISLLQSSYRIFAKIFATRLQTFLGSLIGGTQQGFVLGRKMDKDVTIMMATLTNPACSLSNTPEDGADILFLDFAKAYDALDRDYLFATLNLFGFSRRFVQLMINLHCGTTAEFLVNKDKSTPVDVTSGIRQGCPLAPLLFIIAVEPLALAILQSPAIQGINPTTQPGGEPHKFSAFVDDSTVFLKKASQIEPALELVHKFGKLSGLKIQTKQK